MIAAISTGPETHLDHLAPLCALWQIPLIVTSKDHFELGVKFYPMIEILYVPLEDFTLEYIAAHFDTIVTCGKFWAMELKPPLKMLYQKELRFLFVPHGYSDKEELLNKPVNQDIQFTYEDLGNLRYEFYLQHKTHFDELAKSYFKTQKKTILYAPTWQTTATSTSFFESTGTIIESLSGKYNLLIKLHPLLEENDPARFHRIIGKYESTARFILNFPSIYPLLEKTDIYLGDHSSVGYDFLTYNRPMFFLKQGGKLSNCGELFEGAVESEQEHLHSIRETTYLSVFGQRGGSTNTSERLLRLGASISASKS
ncbi:MAG: CDP-glycerol glycerophosphotransferase family protein [Verrucomicrobia bacterium]|nr:CDP-glycerol glycerophosphotransferase family protein [Verrucomicrobiota bacterium]